MVITTKVCLHFTNLTKRNNWNYILSGGFGAFSGPPPPPPPQQQQQQQNNNNQSYGRPSNHMGMGNSGFGMNPMQQNQSYGGMKRPSNQMNDGNMSKRSRLDMGSWGVMGGDGNDISNNGPQQQTNMTGNWYQDPSYPSSQQQSSYSWNWPLSTEIIQSVWEVNFSKETVGEKTHIISLSTFAFSSDPPNLRTKIKQWWLETIGIFLRIYIDFFVFSCFLFVFSWMFFKTTLLTKKIQPTKTELKKNRNRQILQLFLYSKIRKKNTTTATKTFY